MKFKVLTYTPTNCSMCEFFSFSVLVPLYKQDHCHRWECDTNPHLGPCHFRQTSNHETVQREIELAEKRFADALISARQKKVCPAKPSMSRMRNAKKEDGYLGDFFV